MTKPTMGVDVPEEQESGSVDQPTEPARGLSNRQRHSVGGVFVLVTVAVYILAVRTFQRGIPLLSRVEKDLPQLFICSAVAVGIGSRRFPRAWARLKSTFTRLQLNGPILLALAIVICISPALLSWLDTRWAYSKIAGVIPWSDAKDYHIGGMILLDDAALGAFTMRRPMNAGFYATRLALTGGNFWYSMLLQGALAGAAAFLLLRTVSRRLGGAAALVFAAVMYPFIRPLIDLTLSESLGFTVGCLALAALWQGVSTDKAWLFSLGLLMLSTALNIRAGQFFVLPALLVWLIVDNVRERRLRWKPVAAGLGAVVGGFLLTASLNAQFGTTGGSSNSNFAYTLYGLAHGGTGWTSYQSEFSGQDFATEGGLANAVYRAAISEIREHPWNLVHGLVKGFRTYFDQGIYGYAAAPLATLFFALALFGWFRLMPRGADRRLGTMLVSAWIGMVLSMPFIFEDGGYRVIAATIPILAALPAAGAGLLATSAWTRFPTPDGSVRGLLRFGEPVDEVESVTRGRQALIAGCCAATVVVLGLGPTAAIGVYDAPSASQIDCAEGDVSVVAQMGEASPHVTIVEPGDLPRNFGEMTLQEFRSDPTWGGIEIGPAFLEIEAGSVLVGARNLAPSEIQSLLVVAPVDELPHGLRLVRFCGHPFADSTAALYGLMTTDEFEVVNP